MTEKVRFSGGKGPPEKAGEAKVRVRVRALTVMDLAPRRRCVLHRGRSVAEGTPLSATDRIEEEIPHVKLYYCVFMY